MTDLPVIDPDYAEPPEPPVRKRRPRALIAAIAVLPLLGVTALVLHGADDGAGASSPEAAVRKLADALDREDPVAALAVLPPEEVDGVNALYTALRDKLVATHVVDSKDKPMQGLDIKVSDLELSTERLADDVSLVRLQNGRVESDFDPAKASTRVKQEAGAGAKPTHESQTVADARKELADSGAKVRDVFVMTVRREGHWYVSPSYTLAEYLRQQFDLPAARFDQAPQGNGAASPKAAVEQSLNQSVRLNTDFIKDLPPDRFRVAYDYQPALQAALDKLNVGSQTTPRVKFTTISLEEKALSATSAKVSLKQLKGSIEVPGEASGDVSGPGFGADFELSGLCGTVVTSASKVAAARAITVPSGGTSGGMSGNASGYAFGAQTSDEPIMPTTDEPTTDEPTTETQHGCLSDLGVRLPFDTLFVVTRQVAGRWYVDPIGTLIEYGRVYAAALSQKDVDCVTAKGGKDDARAEQNCPGSLFGH